jgi:hypothetical protein
MKNHPSYRRLPGKRRTLGRRFTLWLGEDHLLSVESTGYSEDYTRFYLADIRGVLSRRTRNGRLWNIFLALATAVFALFALKLGSGGVALFCGIMGVCFLCATLFNLLLGPTCVCHLLMPLGVQRLPALDREKQVTKLRNRIGPLVSAIQGSVTAEEVASALAAPFAPSPLLTRSRGGAAPGAAGQPASSSYLGGAHWVLFALLLVDAAFSMVQMTSSSRLMGITGSVLELMLFSCSIVALVKQRGSRLPVSAMRLVWAALGALALALVALQIYSVFYAVSIARSLPKGSDLQQVMTEIKAISHPVVAGINATYIVVAVCLGICGLITMRRWRRAEAAPDRNPEA